MEFQVGQRLNVDGREYSIIGKIRYKNTSDGCSWEEYRLSNGGVAGEKWLSVDNVYKEYSVSSVVYNVSKSGYHEVDSGNEVVTGAWGDVDVDVGERARFIEYEDATEEMIISEEFWEDGVEYSTGYYLDADEFFPIGGGSYGGGFSGMSGGLSGMDSTQLTKIIMIAILLVGSIFPSLAGFTGSLSSTKSIAKYMKKSYNYTYTTSITGNQKQNADVYTSLLPLDATVKDIINGIEGDTEDVQQNTEDGDQSVAILTRKEYCLIYVSEDNEVLVQVSTRKYAYTTDQDPYRSTRHTRRYYRRYYYSRGYYSDTTSYSGKYTSPYTNFGDSAISSGSGDTYSAYSSSVRQSSLSARESQGGGLSSGK